MLHINCLAKITNTTKKITCQFHRGHVVLSRISHHAGMLLGAADRKDEAEEDAEKLVGPVMINATP
jgi:hypothetical protein